MTTALARSGAVLFACLAYATVGGASGSVIFVDADAMGANDGASWTDAYIDLQDALADAADNAGVTAVWVAAGTYWPDGPGGSIDATFSLIDDVALVGGLAGNEDPLTFDLADRDLVTNETILSGDLDADDGPGFTDIDDNVYRVVSAIGNSATAIIDGFTISGGHARAGKKSGGGIVSRNPGGATIRNCVLLGNKAEFGGGLAVANGSSSTIENCTFIGNLGVQQGGGVFAYGTDDTIVIERCSFIDNSSANGAGLFAGRNVTVANSVFSGNGAGGGAGGGVYTEVVEAFFRMTNCTLSGNAAGAGGAIYNASGTTASTPALDNCVLWGNTATNGAEVFNLNSAPSFRSCDIQGSGGSGAGWEAALGLDSGGNIDADPLFADSGLRLLSASPCVDAGDNGAATAAGLILDRDGNDRFAAGACTPGGELPVVDMGAYERAAPPAPDGDGDGLPDCVETDTGVFVDGTDTGTDPSDPDTDGDGLMDGTEVDMADGTGCPSPLDPDSDSDLLLDGEEVDLVGTDPCNGDTDGDCVPDKIDPDPLHPGETEDVLEEAARLIGSTILDLDLSLFSGPNDNANRGRRNALANRANTAANEIADGDAQGAIDALTSLLEKVDDQSPPPDWMHPSPEKSDLAACVAQLIAVLEMC
jgi:hypothetical protein